MERELKNKLIQGGKEIALDISVMEYNDLQEILRSLRWGIIVESGENENGYYVKWGNGFMECTKVFSSIDISQAVDSLYQSELINWEFPKPFAHTDYVISGTCSGFGGFIGNHQGAGLNSQSFRAFATRSQSDREVRVSVIGRWE